MRVTAGLSGLWVSGTPNIRFSFAYSRGDNALHRARQEEKHPIPIFLCVLGIPCLGPT
jgi:hypothetical protein